MPFYRMSGLTVVSELTLPGVEEVHPATGETATVSIRRGTVPHALPDAHRVGPNWQMAGSENGGRFLLSVPAVARFLIDGGRDILVEAEHGADEADGLVFLMGSAFGILLHQRESLVLHASAVEVAGRAVAFSGPSGAGKSTLAALLGQRGHRFVTDDLCVVETDGEAAGAGPPLVMPDGRSIKLWEDATLNLGLTEARGAPVRAGLHKHYVTPGVGAAGPLPLAAVYFLRTARHGEFPGIVPLPPADAAHCLRQSLFRPALVAAMGQEASHFRQAARLVGKSWAFQLVWPRDPARLPELADRLEAHWETAPWNSGAP